MSGLICTLCLEEGNEEDMKVAVNGRRAHLSKCHQDKIGGLSEDDIRKLAETTFIKESDYIANKEMKERVQKMKEEMEAELKKDREELEAEKKDLEAKRKAVEADRDEIEAEKKAATEGYGNLSFDLDPGTWIVNFLLDKEIKLSDDEKLMLKSEYSESLPDPKSLELSLSRTYGLKPPNLTRICKVYDYMLKGYLKYRKKQEAVFDFSEGNVHLPEGGRWKEGIAPQYRKYDEFVDRHQETTPHIPQPTEQYHPQQHRNQPPQPQTPPQPGDLGALVAAINQMATSMTTSISGMESRMAAMENKNIRGNSFNDAGGMVARRIEPPQPQQEENSPKVSALEDRISSLTSAFETMQKDREDEKKEQEEERKRKELIAEVKSSVAEMINSNIGPLSERMKDLEREIPNSVFKDFGVRELLDLRKDAREGTLEMEKFNFARRKYEDEREGDKEFKSEVLGGLSKIGDTIGTAMGDAVGKQLNNGGGESPPGAAPNSQVPASQSGNIISFTCESCGNPVNADKRTPIATCLKCGQKYQLLPNSPQPPSNTPEQPAAETPAGGKEGMTIVTPGATKANAGMANATEFPETDARMGE